jgi:hypothetical protein
MIFRYLHKRHERRFATEAFGRFIRPSVLEELIESAAPKTEWQAFKRMLPSRWFVSSAQREAAIREVARLARHYSTLSQDELEKEMSPHVTGPKARSAPPTSSAGSLEDLTSDPLRR